MNEPMTVTVRRCQRCGEDHPNIAFSPLANAVDKWSWWAMCPNIHQPILLAVVGDVLPSIVEQNVGAAQ